MHVRKFWFNFIELNPTVFLPFSKKPFINYDSEEYFEATLTEKIFLENFGGLLSFDSFENVV
jgi:hypothetical protein